MKIVHIIHFYYPKIGGIEKVVQFLAEEQAKLGHDVKVMTSQSGIIGRPKIEIINNVQVIRLKSRRFLFNDLLIPIEEPLIDEADIIHVHSQNSLFSFKVAEKLKKKVDAKVVFYFMAVDAFKDHPNLLLRLLAPYYGRRYTLKALKLSDLSLVRSLRDLEIIKKRYAVDATFLPDGVPNSYFSTKRKSKDLFFQKADVKQRNIFLYVGRLTKLKGPQTLVNALQYVTEDTAAVFVGPDGGYLKKTIALAEKLGVRDRIYMLGYVDEDAKIQAIDAAVALINPSIADYVEVYPGVISEAWARKKPVIASRVGGIPFRVKDGLNGILVDPLDPKSLADAMIKLVKNDTLAEEMGRNGASDVLSWTAIAKKSIELYSNILKH